MDSRWLAYLTVWMQAIQALGCGGWIAFTGIYTVACLFFVPGSVLMFVAGAVYGFRDGLILSLIGTSLSTLLSLLIVRHFLRDRAAHYFSHSTMFKALEAAVDQDGGKIVFLAHLSPVMPFSLLNYAFSLTRIRGLGMVVATVMGTFPPMVVYVYLGSVVGNLAMMGPEIQHHRPMEWALQGIGLAATIGVTVYLTRAASRVLKTRLPDDSGINS